MGYPDNSTPSDHAESTFDRLKAAAGLGKSRPANGGTLELSAKDVVGSPSMPAPAPAPTAASAVPHVGPSVLAANVEMTGSLNSASELHIYGAVDGNVRAGDLTIFAGGSVKGDVVAQSVLVHGRIDGHIHAKKVQLCSGAVVRGDIVHASLGVDADSTFEGVSKRSQDPHAEAKPAAPKRNGPAAASSTVRYSSPS
jgi:cytoskeletal protein CcmA (bactofilin family)